MEFKDLVARCPLLETLMRFAGFGSVPCHFCGDRVYVGDNVTLYHPCIKDESRPVAIHVCRHGVESIIGCAREGCIPENVTVVGKLDLFGDVKVTVAAE